MAIRHCDQIVIIVTSFITISILLLHAIALGNVIHFNDGNDVKLLDLEMKVSRFARHKLCKGMREHLFHALQNRFCNLSAGFTVNFVADLCRHKNALLNKFVAEIFDIDGDGIITHFEHWKLLEYHRGDQNGNTR